MGRREQRDIAAGTATVLVRTPITDDAANEVSEAFTLTATVSAGTTSNAAAAGTGTITDFDTSLGGFIYVDANNNGSFDLGETPISGVTVTLTGLNDLGASVTRTALTDGTGAYDFTNMRPGTYTLAESQPGTHLDGKDALGSLGGTLGNDTVTGIVTLAGQTGVNYNFGELRASSIAGSVFSDANNDGLFNGGDSGLTGVNVTLTGTDDLGGTVSLTTPTGGAGGYSFDNLRPGNYVLTESQPGTHLDGKDALGTQGGTLGNDTITAITLAEGTTGTGNTFGEVLASSLSGSVFLDLNNNGTREGFESGVPNVTITITGTDDLGAAVSLTTTTANDGSYSFAGLRPSAAGGYVLTETQPAGYTDGTDAIGSQGGVTANDVLTTVAIAPGTNGTGNTFGEQFAGTLTKSFVSTTLAATTGSDLVVGEVARFRLVVTVPYGTLNDFQISEALPAGLRFLDDGGVRVGLVSSGGTQLTSSAVVGAGLTSLGAPTAVLPGSAISTSPTADLDGYASGTDVFFKLGTLTNLDTTGAVESVVIEFNALVVNELASQTPALLGNSFALRFDTTGDAVSEAVGGVSNTVTSTVAEPILALDKQITSAPAPIKAGDTITYTVTIQHAAGSGSTAWEATLADTVPAGLQLTSIVSTTLAGGAQTQTAATIGGGGTSLNGVYDIPVGSTVTIVYRALVTSDAVLGSTLNNLADLTWSSLDGTDANERGSGDGLLGSGGLNDYQLQTTAAAPIDSGAAEFTLAKSIVGDANAEIGERLHYSLTITVADGTINGLTLDDVLPAGFQLVNGSALLTASNGVSVSGAVFSYTASQLGLSIGQIQSAVDAVGNTITITYDVDVIDSAANDGSGITAKTNTATTSYDPGTGPILRSDSETVNIVEPIVAANRTIISAPAAPDAGDTITYQVVLGHAPGSTGNAYNVAFTDTLPAGFTNVTLTAVSGTAATLPALADFAVGGGTISTLVPFDIEVGTTVVLTYSVVLADTVTPGASLANSVLLTAASTDLSPSGNARTPASATNGGNYDATGTATFTTANDLAIQKSANVTTATIGDRVTYTILVNVNEGTTPGFVITDLLPTGPQLDLSSVLVSFGSAGMTTTNPTPVSFAGNTLTLDFGTLTNPGDNLAANDTVTITYQVVVADNAGNVNGVTQANTASATYTGLAVPVSDGASFTVTEPVLDIVKTVNDSMPHLGDTLTYTLTITHVTPGSTAAAFDLVLSDALPAGLSLIGSSITAVGASITANTSVDGGALSLVLDQLALGGTVTITYQAVVTSDPASFGAAITNTVNFAYDSQPGTPPDGERPGTDTAGTTITIVGGDLAVTKDDGVTSVNPSGQLTYTLHVTTNGTDAATNIVVSDTLPQGVTFNAALSTAGATFSSGVVTFNLASLAIGASADFTLVVDVNVPAAAGVSTLTNAVVVTHDDVDPTPGDNQDDDTDDLVATPDYEITKTDNVTSARPGETLTYLITVRNVGNQDGTGVVVSDTFTTGIFSSVTASNGGVVDLLAGTVSWAVGDLGASDSITLTLTATLNATFPIISVPLGTLPGAIPDNNAIADTVSVTDDGTGGVDPTPANNTATDIDDLVPVPELRITKTDGVTVAKPGQILRYTIVATNAGLQDSNGTVVTDILPPGVTFVRAASTNPTVTGGAVNAGGKVFWTFDGALAAGESVTLIVTVRVNANVAPGTKLTNTVTITDDGRYGPDVITRADNTAKDSDDVPPAPFTPPAEAEDAAPTPVPFIFAFDTFHNFAGGGSTLPFGFQQVRIDAEVEPLLPLMPIYSGEADPGATLVIEIFNSRGECIGSQTVVVDSGGNWMATFPSSTIKDAPNNVHITQQAAPYSMGEAWGHNLRTYFSPAINPGHFFAEALHGAAALSGESAPLLGGLGLENPLQLGAVKYGGEMLGTQATASGY